MGQLKVSSFTLSSQASPIPGTGWDNQYIDAGTAGKISDSTTASLLPSKESIKFETTHISSGYTGRYHAEKHYAKGYKRDEENITVSLSSCSQTGTSSPRATTLRSSAQTSGM